MPAQRTYFEVLTAAINELAEHGFDSAERINFWTRALREAAERALPSDRELEEKLRQILQSVYGRMIDKGGVVKFHHGISRFTIDKVRPALRAELDRRIMASAKLIELDREQAITKTLQRFQGWATSIPAGGSDVARKQETKTAVRKPLANLSFEVRRLNTDQSFKLVSALNDILARDGGAIAAEWRHINRGPPAYDARPEHVARNGEVFAIRDNWALQKGRMKPGPNGYTDQIEQPGERVFCSCYYVYIYSLGRLPQAMLTAKGVDALRSAREQMAS